MAEYSRTFTTTCPSALIQAINDDVGITPTVIQIINLGNGTSIFDFSGSLSSGEVTTFDGILSVWSCPGDPTEGDDLVVDDDTTSDEVLWTAQQISNYISTEIAAVSAGDPTNVNGKLFEVTFAYQSVAKNRWIPQESSETNLSSDIVPYIVPWNSELLAVTFNNQYYGIDTDVELWTAALNANPNSTKSNKYTWELRNIRAAILSNFGGSPPTFTRGERVGIYIRDRGTDPKGVVIKLMFRMTDNTKTNVSDNIPQNFTNNGDDDD